jgi:hypothetical protein
MGACMTVDYNATLARALCATGHTLSRAPFVMFTQANTTKPKSQMSRREFCVAMKLIALAQVSAPPADPPLLSPVLLPLNCGLKLRPLSRLIHVVQR